MCEPMTLAAISATMAAGSAAVGIGAAASHGAESAGVARRNSVTADEAAADAVARSSVAQMRTFARGSATVAAQRTELAAGGSDVNAGSAAAVQEDTRLLTQMDEDVIRNNAAREAWGYRVRGQQFQQEASYAERTAQNEELGSFIGGVGKIAGILGPRIADSQPGTTRFDVSGKPDLSDLAASLQWGTDHKFTPGQFDDSNMHKRLGSFDDWLSNIQIAGD